MNDLTQKEIENIALNTQKMLSLSALRQKRFEKIVVNNGAVVILANDFELTEDNALTFFCDGTQTGEIDLESLVCIKSNITDYVNIIID